MPESNLSILLMLPSFLSIAGTLSILITYYRFPRLRSYRHVELAVYVAINDLFGAIELAIGHLQTASPACWFQGIGTSYNFLASVLWNSVITYQIYVIVNRGTIIEDLTLFHVLCWVFPLFPVLLPIITNNYGPNESTWCFLVNRPDSPPDSMFVWELMSFFVWLWISMFFNSVVFGMIVYRLREMECAESLAAYRPLYRLAFCPFILVLCWSLPSFLILFSVATERNYDGPGSTAINSLSTFLPPFQGFLMSIAFFTVNESARFEWRQYFKGGSVRSTARRQNDQVSVVSGMHTQSSRTSLFEVDSRAASMYSTGTTPTHSGPSTRGSEEHWVSRSSKSSRESTISDDQSIIHRHTHLLDDNSAF